MTSPLWVLKIDWYCQSILAQLARATVPPSQCMMIAEYRQYAGSHNVRGTLVANGMVLSHHGREW